jgi:hypothetical protein
MAQTIYLHVGAPKSGTTYIEATLWRQRRKLLADGVWMPGHSPRAHDALMGDVRGGIWKRPDAQWTWDRFAAEARERDGSVLVSKEMLAPATAEQAAHAVERLDGAEVHVVITCRDLGGTLPSWWQQGVKAGSKIPFTSWLEGVRAHEEHGFWQHCDPVSILRRWAPDFPAERVHVVTMPARGGEPELLWQRFASVIGVDPAKYRTPRKLQNQSLGAVEVELLRRLNITLGDDLPVREPYLSTVHPWLINPLLLEEKAEPARFGLPDDFLPWVRERAQRSVEELRDYPCQLVGDLGDLAVPPVSGPAPEHLPEGVVARRAVEAIALMMVTRYGEEQQAQADPSLPPPAAAPSSRARLVRTAMHRVKHPRSLWNGVRHRLSRAR